MEFAQLLHKCCLEQNLNYSILTVTVNETLTINIARNNQGV